MEKLITGKVRDVYEVGMGELVIVTTDRISAFDVILPTPILHKGIALNLISNYWFDFTKNIIQNHIVSTNLNNMPNYFSGDPDYFNNRTVLVKKLKMLPYEFVVRGYIFGNMWSAYKSQKSFCGQKIVGEYRLAEQLAGPIITPSAKNSEGHDEYISMSRLYSELGEKDAKQICDICFNLYDLCYQHAKKRGIIIADTKFEFGFDQEGVLTLGDEIFTPDSSRFWDATDYRVGESPRSYDKQFVRDWLIENHLDGVQPAPELPSDILKVTSDLYVECYRKITGKEGF